MNNSRIKKDFNLYAKDFNVSSLKMHYAQKQIENSLTPYIPEERPMNVVMMDVFSRLLMDRIIFLAGPVNESMALYTIAQLQYLDSVDRNDITFQISSPGGEVASGLAIIDVMNYINSDIKTINIQLAASMGSLLLGAGTKGKRSALRFSKTMLHQSSGGAVGNIQDAEITMNEWRKINDTLFELLGLYTSKEPEVVKNDATRDLWLSAQEAKDYGIIDEIILNNNKS